MVLSAQGLTAPLQVAPARSAQGRVAIPQMRAVTAAILPVHSVGNPGEGAAVEKAIAAMSDITIHTGYLAQGRLAGQEPIEQPNFTIFLIQVLD